MNIAELNARFGAPGRIVFKDGLSGFPNVILANRYGNAELALMGGNVLSYRPTGIGETLFRPSIDLATYPDGSSLHGGIPVCWPMFGGRMTKKLPGHGFARKFGWEVRSTEYSEEKTEIVIGLKSNAETMKIWPYEFDLELKVIVSMKLNLQLTSKNIGKKAFEFSAGFHPYFRVMDRDRVSVKGLDGITFVDGRMPEPADTVNVGDFKFNPSPDHIFSMPGAPKHELALIDEKLGRAIAIVSSGNTKTVCWNCGEGGESGDLVKGDWQKFVCIEPVTNWPSGDMLEPGAKHELLVAIQASLKNCGKLMKSGRRALVALVGMAMAGVAFGEAWPVVRTYEGAALAKVKMPMGGIGTGTISLSGRGSLVDWEVDNRPAKGFTPRAGFFAPHFAIRCETADGKKVGRLLEGPLLNSEFEGYEGCQVQNHGFPRFERAVFKAAYPLATIDFFDKRVPLQVSLEAFNPLVKGDASASGIPAVYFRWRLKNPTAAVIKASICGTVIRKTKGELVIKPAPGVGVQTGVDEVREPGWNVGLDRYWRRFVDKGEVVSSPVEEPKSIPAMQRCVAVELKSGEEAIVPFVIAWRNPKRMAWDWGESKIEVGNFYCGEYKTAEQAADRLLNDVAALEAKTIGFVKKVITSKAPDIVKEAALFNLSTLRTETCFRTPDGNFYGWEGCRDDHGSCLGSCTHVWGYEHCLVDIWPDLARTMLDNEFGIQLDPKGHMVFRVGLPLRQNKDAGGVAAADGQMQCIVKAYEYWKKTGDGAWLKKTWPGISRALSFCWIEGGWDADQDGVMEGCQHNTMDVEYYGPNPQMGFLYLAALASAEAMATEVGEASFAAKCRVLKARGSDWIEKNLFNGDYYIHRITPPKGKVAKGLKHGSMGARDASNPDYQLGEGCLIDQLVGDFAARAVGLGPVADVEHAKKTIATIVLRNRKAPDDDQFNNMRGYAMYGEESLRMAWYPEGRLPKSPFPYYRETMTGFEYVVAALQVMYGDKKGAERTVRNIRDRYDGIKRSPFDEAECGHHYARTLDAWTVLKAFDGDVK